MTERDHVSSHIYLGTMFDKKNLFRDVFSALNVHQSYQFIVMI